MATKSRPTHVRLIDPLTGQMLREHRGQERGSRTKIIPAALPCRPSSCCLGQGWPTSGSLWACLPWRKSTAWLPLTMPARWPWKPRRRIPLRAPLSGTESPLPFGLHQVDPLTLLKEKDGIAISQIEHKSLALFPPNRKIKHRIKFKLQAGQSAS